MAYQTILNNVSSDYGGPYVYYKVEVQTANRTSSTVGVDVRAYGRLNSTSSTLLNGNVLTGTITIAGISKTITIHGYNDYWYGTDSIGTGWRSPGTVSFTVTGLASSTTTLSATFGVECTYLGSRDTSGRLNTRNCSNVSISSYTPPAPSVNTISVQSIPTFLTGYDGDSFALTCIPSGGTGYTYKWYKGATIIGTSQNLKGTLSNSAYDNTYVYCIVTDSTGGKATTNKCEFRVGTSVSQTQVSTKQVEPVRIYSGSKFLYGIPFIYNSGWKYSSWNII